MFESYPHRRRPCPPFAGYHQNTDTTSAPTSSGKASVLSEESAKYPSRAAGACESAAHTLAFTIRPAGVGGARGSIDALPDD